MEIRCISSSPIFSRSFYIEYYLEQIEDIVSRFNKPFLGSDIIAGFVGETEEEFATTVENLKKSKLSQIHTFPYSIRKGTIAEKLSGHLDEKIKEERAAVIKQISAEKFFAFQKSNIGDVVGVLIEKHPDKKTGLFKGVTANYLNVIMPNAEFNTLKKVRLTGLDGNRLIGEVVE